MDLTETALKSSCNINLVCINIIIQIIFQLCGGGTHVELLGLQTNSPEFRDVDLHTANPGSATERKRPLPRDSDGVIVPDVLVMSRTRSRHVYCGKNIQFYYMQINSIPHDFIL